MGIKKRTESKHYLELFSVIRTFVTVAILASAVLEIGGLRGVCRMGLCQLTSAGLMWPEIRPPGVGRHANWKYQDKKGIEICHEGHC